MAAPVVLRSDYDARALRELAKASKDADQTRRLLPWRRFMTGLRGVMPPRSVGSAFRRCATGCFGLMPRVRPDW
jgi:hypothetical protein